MNKFEFKMAKGDLVNKEQIIVSKIETLLSEKSNFNIFTKENKINIEEIKSLIEMFEEYEDFLDLADNIRDFVLNLNLIRKKDSVLNEDEKKEILVKFNSLLKEKLKISSN